MRKERQAKKSRNPYEKPTIAELTTEQAKRKLLSHASKGDNGAKELLEMISPEARTKEPKAKKKSA